MDDAHLSRPARRLLLSPDHEMFLSTASAWEMAVKSSLGKLELALPLQQLLGEERERMGVDLLPITLSHIVQVERLPFHHRDPFDRLLAAQALQDGLLVLSSDPSFDRYGVKRRW
jgi:PIN domain nuclease of toxin-antitoxin system